MQIPICGAEGAQNVWLCVYDMLIMYCIITSHSAAVCLLHDCTFKLLSPADPPMSQSIEAQAVRAKHCSNPHFFFSFSFSEETPNIRLSSGETCAHFCSRHLEYLMVQPWKHHRTRTEYETESTHMCQDSHMHISHDARGPSSIWQQAEELTWSFMSCAPCYSSVCLPPFISEATQSSWRLARLPWTQRLTAASQSQDSAAG